MGICLHKFKAYRMLKLWNLGESATCQCLCISPPLFWNQRRKKNPGKLKMSFPSKWEKCGWRKKRFTFIYFFAPSIFSTLVVISVLLPSAYLTSVSGPVTLSQGPIKTRFSAHDEPNAKKSSYCSRGITRIIDVVGEKQISFAIFIEFAKQMVRKCCAGLVALFLSFILESNLEIKFLWQKNSNM